MSEVDELFMIFVIVMLIIKKLKGNFFFVFLLLSIIWIKREFLIREEDKIMIKFMIIRFVVVLFGFLNVYLGFLWVEIFVVDELFVLFIIMMICKGENSNLIIVVD